MAEQDDSLIPDPSARDDASHERDTPTRAAWQEPRLTFVQPELTTHGSITELTADDGFFGTFTP